MTLKQGIQKVGQTSICEIGNYFWDNPIYLQNEKVFRLKTL